MIELAIENFPKQQSIFDSPSRRKIVAKGRRFGLTKGAANDFIRCALEEKFTKGLWVDVVNGNIERYIERYFIPKLKPLPQNLWNYRKQAKILEISGAYIDFRSADRPECYDDQTEILTEDGWKLFKDLTQKEKVLTLDPQTLIAQWDLPSKYVVKPYKGAMKHFTNKKIDLLITPNHRFHVISQDGVGKFKEISNCNSHDRIPAKVNFRGKDIKWITEDICAFIGFFLAEGTADKNKGGYRITFAQTKGDKGGNKGDVRSDFITILKRMKVHFHEEETKITLLNKKLYEMVKPLGNKYTKRLPKEIKNLPSTKLAMILKWMIKGDGAVRLKKGRTIPETVYYSVSKRLIDDFQEMLIKCGYSGSIRVKTDENYISVMKDGRIIRATVPCYEIYICNNKYNYFSNGQSNFVKDAYYIGKVYCVEVKTHIVMVRRNGKICWSGNTLEGFGYDKAFINEAGIVLKNEYLWDHAIRPMFWDYPCQVVIGGTPKGKGKFFELAERGKAKQTNYEFFHFSSFDNPYLPVKELREDMETMPERVIRQEVYGEFLEDTGVVFRGILEIADAIPKEPYPDHTYVIGCDLAKVQDYTVLAVFDCGNNRQVYQARWNKLDWGMQKARIAQTSRHFNNARVVVDATGLGDPVVEDLARMEVPVEPFKFTNDSKRQLIEKLSGWIETKKIHILNVPETISELTNFTYDISEVTGRVRYEAPVGFHDDIVCGISLAVWGLNPIYSRESDKEPSLIHQEFQKRLARYKYTEEGEADANEWAAI